MGGVCRCLAALETRSTTVSRADQRNMSKTASVAFVKVRVCEMIMTSGFVVLASV